jgi:hypothetical protein
VTHHAVLLTQLLSALAVMAGLVLICLTVLAETGSITAALFAEAAASFSVNLWRWNGSLMEATFAFAVVALTLYLFRKDASSAWPRVLGAGVVLGIGMLLRPEMGIVLLLALFVQWMRSGSAYKVRDAALILLGTGLVLLPWCLFALRQFGRIIPTTFAAKSTHHLSLVNPVILRQLGESIVESLLFPTLLVLLLLVVVRSKASREESSADWLRWVIPAGWVFGLFGFYYLKTHGLQSTGRYVLPLLPGEVLLLAYCWAHVEHAMRRLERRIALGFIGAHVVFALALNYLTVTPVLRRFDATYATTMRATADELAKDLQGSTNRRVLVVSDIGVLSCEANGRFEIYDGGALATPSLLGLRLNEMIERVKPAYVVQSLAETPGGWITAGPDDWGATASGELAAVWERRFNRYSVGEATPYYYTIIYEARGSQQVAVNDASAMAGAAHNRVN